MPPRSAWDALRQLVSELGSSLILGVNFEAGDWAVTKAQFDAIRRELPASAVAAVELGNEVGVWRVCFCVYLLCVFVVCVWGGGGG